MSENAASLHRKGTLLVIAAAICWSLGGLIARQITADPWVIVAWRGSIAAVALLLFLLIRDGRQTWSHFRNMGPGGIGVGICFATASISFVIALQHATVALILVVQSTAPLMAGLLAWAWMREKLGWPRIIAMAVALGGIALMFSKAEGHTDATGTILSVVIAVAFAIATVLTRRYSHVRMTPATCLGTALMGVIGFVLAGFETLHISSSDLFYLFLFGAVQLAIGLILFTTGARLIPAAEAALISLVETVLGAFWVFLFLGENPGIYALYGGALVLAAVAGNTLYDQRRAARQPLNVA
ncbi:DMT family transporter [Dongia mobilis]|jgi:drug/metabolite transporter (DMT)-like permease|uniref:DMT family transporter n=1 Tax=Dongia sp. TaxID=1977262 RepID=UPI0026F10EBE